MRDPSRALSTERRLFTPLGIYRSNGGLPRYFLSVDGEIRSYRGWELRCVPFLLDLYPSHDHWRTIWPKGVGRRIDVHAAGEWFIKACQEAGEFEPPEHLKPRDVGRPKKAKET